MRPLTPRRSMAEQLDGASMAVEHGAAPPTGKRPGRARMRSIVQPGARSSVVETERDLAPIVDDDAPASAASPRSSAAADGTTRVALDEAAVAKLLSLLARRQITRRKCAAGHSERVQQLRKKLQVLVTFTRLSNENQAAFERRVLLGTAQRIYAWFKRADVSLPELFAEIDKDGSGQIDAQELRAGMASLGLRFDDIQLRILMRYMDESGDGQLDTLEWTTRMAELVESEASSGQSVLSNFCNHLLRTGQTVQSLFAKLDADRSGELDADEFHAALGRMGLTVSVQFAWSAMRQLDVDGDGTLKVNELVARLEEFQRQRCVFARTVLGAICDYIKATSTSVARIFHQVDADGSGDLDPVELQEALRRMDQDLNELEVEEIMRELVGAELVTSMQFMDALKQFQNEREADIQKCEDLFSEFDKDGSGGLDFGEVWKLVERLGIGKKLKTNAKYIRELQRDPEKRKFMNSDLLQGLISEIEGSKREVLTGAGADGGYHADGVVTYDELLPWFLHTGRSFLPRRIYPVRQELTEPTGEKLAEIFKKFDADGSGNIEADGVVAGCVEIWPYVDRTMVPLAFTCADQDGNGNVDRSEFAGLVRCLLFLNEQRHVIDDVNEKFLEGGVGEGEFYVGLTCLGVIVTDRQAALYFGEECVRLGKERLTAEEFVVCVCRHECISSFEDQWEQRERSLAEEAKLDLEERMTDYGDVFFEDIAAVMFTSVRKQKAKDESRGVVSRHKRQVMMLGKEVALRCDVLRAGFRHALEHHESFPEIPEPIFRSFVTVVDTEVYYAGQNIATQGLLEDRFFVVRRGKADIIVDGETVGVLRAGECFGEMALFYGAVRPATLRSTEPCETHSINRASYQTCMASLTKAERTSPLIQVMEKFWALMSGPDGSRRPEVDYATFLKYHQRVTKSLSRSYDFEDYDYDEHLEIAREDWEEDTRRHHKKATDGINQAMFFDSLYQTVDLWAADVNVSFAGFLERLFSNIAGWNGAPVPDNLWGTGSLGFWTFKDFESEVTCDGDYFDTVLEEAEKAAEAAERSKVAAEEFAERLRSEQEGWGEEQKARLRAEQTIREERQEIQGREHHLKSRVERIDAKEQAMLRRKAAQGLAPYEEKVLANIVDERRNAIEQLAQASELITAATKKRCAAEVGAIDRICEAIDAEERDLVAKLDSGDLSLHTKAAVLIRRKELQGERTKAMQERKAAGVVLEASLTLLKTRRGLVAAVAAGMYIVGSISTIEGEPEPEPAPVPEPEPDARYDVVFGEKRPKERLQDAYGANKMGDRDSYEMPAFLQFAMEYASTDVQHARPQEAEQPQQEAERTESPSAGDPRSQTAGGARLARAGGSPDYWDGAMGLFASGGRLEGLLDAEQPIPAEPVNPEIANEFRDLLESRGHDPSLAGELTEIEDWQNVSGHKLWEHSTSRPFDTSRAYSDDQKKLLLDQAAGQSIALVEESGRPQGAPHEKLRAIVAENVIRQAWKGVLRKPEFRKLMAQVREPRPTTGGGGGVLSRLPSPADERSALQPEMEKDLSMQISTLAKSTGIPAPPPHWPGWLQQQNQVATSAPTFMVVSYIFPEDKVQVVYVFGQTERIAWSVPWNHVHAKKNKMKTVSLIRKTDEVYMVGVDKLHWAALQQVRKQAKASEREYLASQLHTDASKVVYPQQSLVSLSPAQRREKFSSVARLPLPVMMKRTTRQSFGGMGSMATTQSFQSMATTAQSLQSLQEGSLPNWYFKAMDIAAADGSEQAISDLLKMARVFEETKIDSQRRYSGALQSAVQNVTPVSSQAQMPMVLVPQDDGPEFQEPPVAPQIARQRKDKIQLLPATDMWLPRTPSLMSPRPGSSGSQFRRSAGISLSATVTQVGGLRAHSQQKGRTFVVAGGGSRHEVRDRPGWGGLDSDEPTYLAVGASETHVWRRAIGTLATTRPATTTGGLRPRMLKVAVLKVTPTSAQRATSALNYYPTPPRSVPSGSAQSARVPRVQGQGQGNDQLRANRRIAAESKLAQMESAAGQVHVRARPGKLPPAMPMQRGGSRPISRVDFPPDTFLYQAF